MNLNQVTLPAVDMARSVHFYSELGFNLIVDTPHYARFECPHGDATFSLLLSDSNENNSTTIYFEHEKGTDEALANGVNVITSNIESGDFDITAQRSRQGQQTGVATFQGDGEFLMKIRRFVPDFLSQTGSTQVTLQLRNYPNSSQASSPLGPFTITSSTDKVDTRARARAMSLKIANTAANQSWKLGTFRLDTQPDGRR